MKQQTALEHLKTWAKDQSKEDNDLCKQYIAEAEHQDGAQYWQRFRTRLQLINDVVLYIALAKSY